LVEEPSAESFLRALLPRLLPPDRTFQIHPFQGKQDLLGKLESRLRAYAQWLPEEARIVVIVDRDADECTELKERLESHATTAGLRTRSSHPEQWQIVNRVAVEELEAWYFGDWPAVCEAYPRLPLTVPQKKGFRDSDAILGGTWEAFERILQKSGYFETGLRKMEAARVLGGVIVSERSTSSSFVCLRDALVEATL
jgi:hypothetical protein